MKRLAREPLVQFLILGGLLFCFYQFTSARHQNQPKHILVTEERQSELAARFSATWGREPSPAEFQRLIDNFVREEIYCREAVALGFDRDDPLIRSQLVQNIQFVPDELAAQDEPTDAELQSFISDHPNLFAVGRLFTFRQVYLNPEYHRGDITDHATQLIQELTRAGDRADLLRFGDPYALPHDFTNAPSSDLVRQLGEPFTALLGTLPVGQWSGPFESKYGLHLVLILSRTAGRLPSLKEERGYIRKEWMDARRAQKRDDFYQSLRKQYVVSVQTPNSTSEAGKTPGKP